MAFASILRRSASTVAPIVTRLALGQRSFGSALFTALNHHVNLSREHSVSFPSYYSTAAAKKPSATESLLRVIESEIKCARETDDHDRVEEIPKGFPFKSEDNPGEQIVTLTREYEGETIKVLVQMPGLVTGENNEIGDADGDDENEKAGQSSVPLVVTSSKKSGLTLEFNCVAYPDEIAIDGLSVRHPENSEDQFAYEGPDFHDLDENLKKAFHKYLEIRGIKPSTTNFLHEYMINKDSREYVFWLNNLKKFMEA
ncbi:hypothetical protein HS088_TW16G00282 [Tripterygium wilfordii]|uniref:Mitochondrial glycoprotein family protein n=1 Tax=Tripterygium wilfordii TaxID=458696 RepID=A0A7J7CIJ3_TRIWF|nr:uncharacterized protein At2g39795, mitochondrial-like [Tripterygium wilfordii]KAF5733841.1 hypothetical protein HS088_TW16G00282 [Tripterygium wilfordii]